jgi:hypothetical protein
MSDIAEKAFAAARMRLKKCRKQMYAVNSAKEIFDQGEDEYLEREIRDFEAQLRQVYSTLVFVFEALQLSRSLDQLAADFQPFLSSLTMIEHFEGEHEHPYSPALDFLDAKLSLIEPLVSVSNDTAAERRVVASILSQSPVLMESNPPKKEGDLHDALEKVLCLGFPDCIRNPSIKKPTKTFKPDFGIETLSTAIEIKYVNSKSDKGKVLGQLVEDMEGYAGAPEWTAFQALIYQTGAFLTQEMVDAEIKKLAVSKNWRICVRTGAGI